MTIRGPASSTTETRQRDTLRANARQIVRETRLSQGLPETITDPVVLARLATLIRAAHGEAEATKLKAPYESYVQIRRDGDDETDRVTGNGLADHVGEKAPHNSEVRHEPSS